MGNCCGIDESRQVGASQLTSRVLKNPDLWYERAMLLPHEAVRRLIMSLQQMYQYEHLVPQWKRKLLSYWYNTYFYDFLNEHHEIEEKALIPWLKTKVNEIEDVAKADHQKLVTDMNNFKSHFQTLAQKKSIAVKDIDIQNMVNFCEFLLTHLDQEEGYWVPLLKDNFSQEEYEQYGTQVMQKIKNVDTILVLLLDALKEWGNQEIYDQLYNKLPLPLQKAYPMYKQNYELKSIRTIALICSGMEKEPVGYLQPGPTKITSRIIKNPKEWYEKSLLKPHEFVRRLMFNLQEMHTFQNLKQLWKRKLISRWYNEVFCVLVHEHHDAEEKILQPLLKQKFPKLKDITSESHNKLLKEITNFQTYFANLTKKVSITQKDIDIKGLNTFVDFMLLHLDQEEEYWPKIIKDHLTQQDEQQITGQILQTAKKPELITAVFVEALKEWETPENFAFLTSKALPPHVLELLPSWIEEYNNNQRRWYRVICSNVQEELQAFNIQQKYL